MNNLFWKGKKVLITGHTGFKGSWLSLWLQKKGADLTGYSLSPPTEPNLFDILNLGSGMVSVLGNVCDIDHLKAVFKKTQPQIVIHMAAQSLVRYSYKNPVETFTTNVMGTVNILEAARSTESVKVALIITSDKCYKNREWVWGYRENDPMGGHDPYSSSKGCAELVTSAYRNSYFSQKNSEKENIAVASARAGNVIGGGDWGDDRLIPDIIKAVMDNQSVKIRNPEAVRPWQHVLDPLNGYLCLIEKLYENGSKHSSGWNFGPDIKGAKSVFWITSQISRIWDDKVNWVKDFGENKNPHEANYLKLDCSKANSILGWKSKLDILQSLKMVVEWYKHYINHCDMREFTESQIDKFENMEIDEIE